MNGLCSSEFVGLVGGGGSPTARLTLFLFALNTCLLHHRCVKSNEFQNFLEMAPAYFKHMHGVRGCVIV